LEAARQVAAELARIDARRLEVSCGVERVPAGVVCPLEVAVMWQLAAWVRGEPGFRVGSIEYRRGEPTRVLLESGLV
jgi:hypothetical protein